MDASTSDGNVFGLVYECDLVASTSTSLRLRTVAYQAEAFGSWLDIVATAESGKPSGWWTNCECVSNCGTFDVSPSLPPSFKEIKCCTDGGPEEAAFAKQAVDTYGKTDEGLFGVDLVYRCGITCMEDPSGSLFVYLVGMHTALITPTPYFGAAEISQWEDRTDRGVPPLIWANPNGSDSSPNMVTLTEDGPLAVL